MPKVPESFLARYLQESPDTAPVLIAVKTPPESIPLGSPVSPSTRIMTALIEGTPFLLLGKTLTTLTLASAAARSANDGMMRTSPDRAASLDLSGESTFPRLSRAKTSAIASMQSAMGQAFATSSASRIRILTGLALPPPSHSQDRYILKRRRRIIRHDLRSRLTHVARVADVGREVQAQEDRRRRKPGRGQGAPQAPPREEARAAAPPLRGPSWLGQDDDGARHREGAPR